MQILLPRVLQKARLLACHRCRILVLRPQHPGHESTVPNSFAISADRSAYIAHAVHLAVAFRETPQRAIPNSTRKRKQLPNLSRPIPTSSHRAEMSMILTLSFPIIKYTSCIVHRSVDRPRRPRISFPSMRHLHSLSR